MVNKHMKRFSTLLIVRKTLKKKSDITSQLSEWLSSKGLEITNIEQDVVKRQLLYTADGNVSSCSHNRKMYGGYSKTVWSFLKK